MADLCLKKTTMYSWRSLHLLLPTHLRPLVHEPPQPPSHPPQKLPGRVVETSVGDGSCLSFELRSSEGLSNVPRCGFFLDARRKGREFREREGELKEE